MRMLYDLGIGLYSLLLRVISPFHAKAKLWTDGRKRLLNLIEQTVEKGAKPVWFHFASLGEFEQGRSVMEALKKDHPQQKILITFFSPSGYEVRKNTPLADYVFYLPADTRRNARRFMDIVQPKFIVFTKYEYWCHYFREAKKRDIRLLMISAIFREDQVFFKWYGGFFRNILRNVSFFFTQDADSALWLKSIHINRAGLAGDTRFDRVVELPAQRKPIAVVEDFIGESNRVLVAGSTWLPDEKLLASYLARHEQWRMVIAPHEIHEARLQELEQTFGSALFYSKFASYSAEQIRDTRVLVIDNIGMLSSLYGYGQVAYIGGGFGVGIHNTLEAATYGVPVIFGPKYSKFREAMELMERGAAFSIFDQEDLDRIMKIFASAEKTTEVGALAARYVQEKAGATTIIYKYIQTEKLLKTK